MPPLLHRVDGPGRNVQATILECPFYASASSLHLDSKFGKTQILRNFAPCCECVRAEIGGMRKAGGVKVQNGEDWGGVGSKHRWSQKGGFEYTWVHTLT